MKVAIIGCGMAGMSTAILLQRRDIDYAIYDSMAEVGDFPARGELMLPIYSRPIWEIPRHIQKRYQIALKPYGSIKKIIFHSRGAKAQATGRVGHVLLRGRTDASLDRQLFQQLKTKVFWNSQVSAAQLQSEYDWVVLATGEAPPGTPGVKVFIFKGGLLKGSFEPGVIRLWHHSEGTPGGYAYLTPLSPRVASMMVVIPEERVDNHHDFFIRFWDVLCHDLGFEPDLLRRDKFTRHLAPQPPAVGDNNYLPVGNCLGSIIPLLGMSNLVAFASAYYAVGQISGVPEYPQFVEQMAGHLQRMHTIQAGMGKWTDATYDMLVSLMKIGATPYFNSRCNLLSMTAHLLRPLV